MSESGNGGKSSPLAEDKSELRARVLRGAISIFIGAGLFFLATKLLPLLPAANLRGKWETPFPIILLGAILGLTYGLLAVGLVLIYRSNRIINFAHGEIGAFG